MVVSRPPATTVRARARTNFEIALVRRCGHAMVSCSGAFPAPCPRPARWFLHSDLLRRHPDVPAAYRGAVRRRRQVAPQPHVRFRLPERIVVSPRPAPAPRSDHPINHEQEAPHGPIHTTRRTVRVARQQAPGCTDTEAAAGTSRTSALARPRPEERSSSTADPARRQSMSDHPEPHAPARARTDELRRVRARAMRM